MTVKLLSDIEFQAEQVPRLRLLGMGDKLIAINECTHAIVLQIGETNRQLVDIPLAANEARDIAGEIPEYIFEGGET